MCLFAQAVSGKDPEMGVGETLENWGGTLVKIPLGPGGGKPVKIYRLGWGKIVENHTSLEVALHESAGLLEPFFWRP
jgi:hypothetical protein